MLDPKLPDNLGYEVGAITLYGQGQYQGKGLGQGRLPSKRKVLAVGMLDPELPDDLGGEVAEPAGRNTHTVRRC